MASKLVQIPQRGLPAESRLQLPVRRIAEDQPAEPVAPMMRGPRQQRRGAARIDRFVTATGCEMHAGAQIGDDQHRPFALLAKELCVGRGAARRNTPVDAARVVTRLIRSRFIEFHAAAPKVGHVRARLQGPHPQHVQRNRSGGTAQANEASLGNADRRRILGDVIEQGQGPLPRVLRRRPKSAR